MQKLIQQRDSTALASSRNDFSKAEEAEEEGAEAIPQCPSPCGFVSPKHRPSQPRADPAGGCPDPALPRAQPPCLRVALGSQPSGHRADCIERLFMSSHTEGTPPNLPFPSNFPPLSSGSSSLPGPGALLQCTPLSNSHQKLSILLPSHFFFPFCFPPVLYLTLKSSPSSFSPSLFFFFPFLLSSCASLLFQEGHSRRGWLSPANQGRHSQVSMPDFRHHHHSPAFLEESCS